MSQKLVQAQFEVAGVDGVNEDGTLRQEILKNFADERRIPVTFNRGPVKENHAQVIEVVLNGQKVGELSDEDYVRYCTSIKGARDAFAWVYEEEQEDGSIRYTVTAVIVIPYNISLESREKLYKRKKVAIIVCLIFFVLTTIWEAIQKQWISVVIGVIICLAFAYWAFVRRPEQDDDIIYYYKTGHKRK